MAGKLATPSQTVGPFFRLALDHLAVADLTEPGVGGRPITIQGTVFDGEGQPVDDALIESWQANSAGQYAAAPDVAAAPPPISTPFRGFARVATDATGHFELRTIMPGPTAGPHGTQQAPYLAVAIFMRGLLKQLVTRIYFGDEETTATDPVLNMVEKSRRHTLLATPQPADDSAYAWDVWLQGPEETVFFDV
jgi:protocatechuate 3,4-dioxygenase, alpha subunit